MVDVLRYSLLIIPLLVILFGLFRKSNSFFNLGDVFKNHFALFKENRTQFATFYLLPLFFAIGLAFFYKVNIDFCENINIITSIILSMLFAICSIVGTKDYSTILSDKDSETIFSSDNDETIKKYNKVKTVAQETFNAIVFTTLISLLLILICLAAIAVNVFTKCEFLLTTTSVIIYYFLGITLLNLLMIIKRMQKLFDAML